MKHTITILIFSLVSFYGYSQNYVVFTSLKESLKEPEKVYTLQISDTLLNEVPGDLILFENLTSLSLRKCHLKSISVIYKMPYLVNLNLAVNNINFINDSIKLLTSLEVFNLSGNPINSIPSEISQLKNLKNLTLIGCPIKRKERKKIKKLLPDCNIDFKPKKHNTGPEKWGSKRNKSNF